MGITNIFSNFDFREELDFDFREELDHTLFNHHSIYVMPNDVLLLYLWIYWNILCLITIVSMLCQMMFCCYIYGYIGTYSV